MSSFSVWFKGLRGRLLGLIAGALGVMGVLVATNYYGLITQTRAIDKITVERLPITTHTDSMRMNENAVVRYLLLALEVDNNPAGRGVMLDQVEQKLKEFKQALDGFYSFQHSEKTTQTMSPVRPMWDRMDSATLQAVELLKKNEPESDKQARKFVLERVSPPAQIISKAIGDEQKSQLELTQGASGNALQTIVASIQKVSTINGQIASASAEQANGIEQISTAMNELDSSTQQNAAASEEVAASSQQMSTQVGVFHALVSNLNHVVDGTKKAEKSAEVIPLEGGFKQEFHKAA